MSVAGAPAEPVGANLVLRQRHTGGSLKLKTTGLDTELRCEASEITTCDHLFAEDERKELQ